MRVQLKAKSPEGTEGGVDESLEGRDGETDELPAEEQLQTGVTTEEELSIAEEALEASVGIDEQRCVSFAEGEQLQGGQEGGEVVGEVGVWTDGGVGAGQWNAASASR